MPSHSIMAGYLLSLDAAIMSVGTEAVNDRRSIVMLSEAGGEVLRLSTQHPLGCVRRSREAHAQRRG
ncbi:MAG: hypothetical protein OXL97_12760 [Chloroflexota bacterium]|nr:hypothetical protein [Chloroflexota bacterium]MDE2885090.1 hypothetical protein [Chloroflexota bacterium]